MQERSAGEALAAAHALHAENKIDSAIAAARQALSTEGTFLPALTYLGTTLITRKLQFEEGLALLERAAALAGDDPGVQYSLGWCYEFVAYRLEKQPAARARDPDELYGLARQRLQRCIDLDPERGLKEDAEDLLASIDARF